MAKKSMVNREVKRAKLVSQHAAKRAALKTVIYDQTKPIEERFKATTKLAGLPHVEFLLNLGFYKVFPLQAELNELEHPRV